MHSLAHVLGLSSCNIFTELPEATANKTVPIFTDCEMLKVHQSRKITKRDLEMLEMGLENNRMFIHLENITNF